MTYSAKKIQALWLPLSIVLASISLCNSSSLFPVLIGIRIFNYRKLLTFIGHSVYDLYPGDINSFTQLANQWTITGISNPNQKVSLCFTYIVSGPIMERLYTDLPSHNFISYTFRIFALGNWQTTDSIKLYLDGVQISQWFPALLPGTISPGSCNGYAYTDVFEMGILAHVTSSIRATLASSIPSNTVGLSFGIHEIRFMLITSTTRTINPSYIQPIDSGTSSGCPFNSYPDSSTPGTCLSCPVSCAVCSGPTNAECFFCNWYFYFDGQQCLACTPNCLLCSGPNTNQCTYCASGYRINWDGTCSLPPDPCPSPYTVQSSGNVVTCNAACIFSGEFTYQDNSCSSTCDSPFTPRIVGTAQFCDGPCSDPSYYYYPSTQLCKPTCPYPNQVSGVKFCILKLDDQDASQMQTINNALTAGSYGISAANPSGFSLAMLAEIIQYIRLMEITYPPKLQYMLDQSDSSSINIIPSIPDAIEAKLTAHEMPGKFEEYEDYSSFLVNFWQSMITLALILVGAVISFFIAKKTKGWRYLGWFWQKMKLWLKWNFFLMNMSSSFGDIIVYSSLEFRTYSKDSTLDPLSLATCIFINLFAVLVLAKMIHVIVHVAMRKIYTKPTKRDKDLQEKWEDYSALYESYKEKSIFTQGFFIFFIFRLLIFYATITYLCNYPLVQSIIITCLSLVALLYIAIIRPFKDLMDFISNILQELILLTVNVCTLSLAIFDIADESNYNGRLLPGDIIIYCNLTFNVIGFASMILQIVLLLWKICKVIRSRFSKKVEKNTKIAPSRRKRAVRGSFPDINLSSDSLAQSSSFSDSKLDMHILNTPSTNSLLQQQNNRVNMIKKPTALPNIKVRPTMIHREISPRYTYTNASSTEEPPFKKIHRSQKNESLIRHLYEMNGNKARSQVQGSNYSH